MPRVGIFDKIKSQIRYNMSAKIMYIGSVNDDGSLTARSPGAAAECAGIGGSPGTQFLEGDSIFVVCCGGNRNVPQALFPSGYK